jgi:hypothetical protein
MEEDSEMRKVSVRTVEIAIGLARSVAYGKTKFPFVGYCADLMERMLEEIKEARKEQTRNERNSNYSDNRYGYASTSY